MKSRKPRLLIAIWLVAIASAFATPLPALAAPITTVDEQGADDQPGQKDLSSHTVDPAGLPTSIEVGWQWDVTSLSGNNTGDACALFDTDGDGKVDAALCVTIAGNPAAQSGVSPRLYTCGDDKVDRCTSPITQVTNFTLTTCDTNTDATDPFHDGEKDTAASCHVQLSEISATTATLVNTCSYPSEQPNSDPSDCVLIPRDAFLKVVKNTVGGDGTFVFTLTPPGGTFATITTSGGTGATAFLPVRSDVPVTLAENVPAGWTLTSISCNGGSPSYNNPSVTVDLVPDQQVTCTFLDTKQNPSLLLDKTANVSTYSAVGQVITYSYLVTNNGNVELAGPVTIADDITTNESCPALSTVGDGDNIFDPGEQITCTSTHTVTQADLNAGSITNHATASAGGTTSNQDQVTVTANQSPALTLDKTAAESTYDAVSDVIHYSYVVTNSGNVRLSGPVSVSDDISTDESCPNVNTVGNLDGFLDPGESITCTATYTITQADLNAGSVTNVATASAGGTTSNQDTVTVTADRLPALTLDKSSPQTTYDEAGDVITYNYLVTNSGNISLAGPVTISDNITTNETCPNVNTVGNLNGFLDPGESITCTSTHTITQADLNAGSVTNVATASAGGTTSNQDTVTVTAVQAPALSLDKSSPQTTYDEVGDVISYNYLVTNTGNVSLAGPVTITDNKTTATCPNVNTVGNNNALLDPGESITCTATYTITQGDLNAGSVTNVATASAGGTTSNQDTVTVDAEQNPALTIVKSADPTTYDSVGDVITYSYMVQNTGNVTLAGPVTIADDITTNETCPALTSVGNGDANLDPGEIITCSSTYTITQADLNSGSVTNTATASAGGTTSPPDSATVTAVVTRALLLDKTADVSTYDSVGDVITYSYLVTNTGNVSLVGPVTVADDITQNEICPNVNTVGNLNNFLDPGESITCTSTHTVTQADLNAGSITNIAVATAANTNSNPDSVTVTADQNPSLTIAKSADVATYDSVGDVITYSYIVTNTGNVRLAGPVTVADDITTNETCPNVNTVGNNDSFLDPGEQITCTSSYTITQDDLNNGSVTNVATASAGGTTSPPDTETVTAEQTRALSLDKSSDVATYDAVGDVITYSYLVKNVGNVRLPGPITITDDITTNESCPNVNTVGNNDSFLDPDEEITCTSTYTITQADLNSGSVTNTATAHAGETTSPPDSVTVTADQNPALTIEKSADVDSYDTVGDVINYTYVVTNSGNVSLAGPVTVSDDITTNESCPNVNTVGNNDAFLDPGESITCTSSYTITQADLNRGSVTNAATATADGTTSPPDSVTVPASQNRALSLDKSADVATYDAVGDVINYSYLVTNTGNVSLPGPVTIDDNITTNESCPNVNTVGNNDSFLDPGESIICTASHTVTQADLNAGSITNTATATAENTTSNPDSVTVTADQNPALTIDKTADVDSYDAVGDVINYTYVVRNTGNVSLAGPVTIDDDITTNESCPALSTVGNNDNFLDPGEQITCTSSYTITQADLNRGSVTNAATAHAGDTTSPPDTVTVPADQNPSLSIDKTADVDSYDAVGDVINYSYVVTNNGNVSLEGPFTVSDDITTNETCPAVNTVGNNDNFLDPGESITCMSSYTITQADLDRGSVTNAATASNGTTTSPPDTVTVPADQNPAIDVEKTGTLDVGDDNVANPGDEISYTITGTNTGNVTLDPVVVEDPLFGEDLVCDTDALAPGQTATCTGTHVLTQADIDAGSVTNTATGTGTPPQGDDVSDSDTEVVTIGQIKDMAVAKTNSGNADQDGSGTITEGDDITYTIGVHNTGNVTLTNVTVTDPVPPQTTFVSCGPAGSCSNNNGTVTWTITSIAPGQTVNVTLTVRIGAITSCEICNIASATAAQIPAGRQSPRLCINPLPVDHPQGAHASGSALGARLRVDLLGINQDIVSVSSSQSGVGHDADQDEVLSLAVPPPGGAIARLGLITGMTSSTVHEAPARAVQLSTAETLGVNLLNGTITADVVRAVARAEANGVGSFNTSAGSTFVNLKVAGVTMANVAPNTTVNLPALLFGKGSYVKLYEKVGSTAQPAPLQLSGGTYAADLTVNMIHVFVKDSLPLIPGNQTAEIIVSGATAHADFPQTTVCAVQPARSVSGHAFIASAEVTVDDPEDPLFLGVVEGFSGIPASGGNDHQELASLVLPDPSGEVLSTEDVASDSFGNIFGPTILASSYAQAANVCLLEMTSGCVVRATLVKSQSNSSAASSGPPGAPTSNPTGTQLVGLEIAGTPINVTPAPNTVINIPGVGFIVLNEQFCDGGGTLANNCTDGLHAGLTVRAIRIVVTLLNPIGVGAEVIVAEAHSDVTRPPYPA